MQCQKVSCTLYVESLSARLPALRVFLGRPCQRPEPALVDVSVPFAKAAVWALSLRRVRLVAKWSGLQSFDAHGFPEAKAVGGEIGPGDWGTDDLIMFEPIIYALRNARRALETCEPSSPAKTAPCEGARDWFYKDVRRLEEHVIKTSRRT